METIQATDVRVEFFRFGEDNHRYIIGEYQNDYGHAVMAFLELECIGIYRVIDLPKEFTLSPELCTMLWAILQTDKEPALRLPGGYYLCDVQAPEVPPEIVEAEPEQWGGEVLGESVIDGHIYGLLADTDNIGPFVAIGILPPDGGWEPIPIPAFIEKNPVIMQVIDTIMLERDIDRIANLSVH